jgi:hypothetical protein
MAVPEETVAQVVGEVSGQMSDPQYGQLALGDLIQRNPDLARYVSAKADKLGGEEQVVQTLFHAHVLSECVRAHRGSHPPPVGFAELDAVFEHDSLSALQRREAGLADYIRSNVEGEVPQQTLALIGLALSAS